MKKILKIGNLEISHPFVLAPLAGITDSPFRRLCKDQGASLLYSEMVSAKGLHYKDKNTENLLYIHPEEELVAYQIFGSEPRVMAEAARNLDNRKNLILDVNMGCPVLKVVKNKEGCALMRNPQLAYDIIFELVKNTSKPVTAKIRLGWDQGSINGIEMAKALEAAGASAIAVHGRTRDQFYRGKANWDEIARIKNAVSIPVMGNGDVFSGQDAIRMLDQTGVDFVMIARGALGNPWIFRECLSLWNGSGIPEPTSLEEKIRTMVQQLDWLVELKGEYSAIREMRKHVGWYVKGLKGSAKIKHEVNKITGQEELRDFLGKLA
jgi:tRNA-dihydrouridine synthase B